MALPYSVSGLFSGSEGWIQFLPAIAALVSNAPNENSSGQLYPDAFLSLFPCTDYRVLHSPNRL